MSFVIPIVLHKRRFFVTAGRMIALGTENIKFEIHLSKRFLKSQLSYKYFSRLWCSELPCQWILLVWKWENVSYLKNVTTLKFPWKPRTRAWSHSVKWPHFPRASIPPKSSSTNKDHHMTIINLQGNTGHESLKCFNYLLIANQKPQWYRNKVL